MEAFIFPLFSLILFTLFTEEVSFDMLIDGGTRLDVNFTFFAIRLSSSPKSDKPQKMNKKDKDPGKRKNIKRSIEYLSFLYPRIKKRAVISIPYLRLSYSSHEPSQNILKYYRYSSVICAGLAYLDFFFENFTAGEIIITPDENNNTSLCMNARLSLPLRTLAYALLCVLVKKIKGRFIICRKTK